ncbi:hypothetical protein NO136_20410, partial [Clostridioides difficile]|nr:hypothetical protein [Clostridioides difficile]
VALTPEQADRGSDAWSPLRALPVDHPLRMLKTGLVALCQDRFDAALTQLRDGMAANREFPLINPYIAAVIERIE